MKPSEFAHIVDVALLPSAIKADQLAGQTVVVVDVLRATTTIVNALHNGCQQIFPQPGIEEARDCHAKMPDTSVIGGERNGKIVDGFHQGNSPLEYTAEAISGKSLILATTNGTVAMESCRAADRVLIGAMINVSAVAKELTSVPRVTVVCSGTDRLITSEDVIFAGLLTERILELREQAGAEPTKLTDPATIAMHHWRTRKAEMDSGMELADFFRNCRGGINLVRIGHDADVQFASQIDLHDRVPELDLKSWSIA
ncbi:2-phosphosulfolactate phosphatase [Mariniblastus fucicola]|uniref:Probable 2-phosphosulfolactate phosphatase n=1 Tax=Mariniblastus fucicola TaxID=980251 RepID=A0A5B9PBH8_9BACT|nr:2-phosphosulfolactate phosphatase [Mariniblastus fucicola]QEG20483.1 putative 2-phosphosulfolactate phosphatase [Mariniblastus fucicola]